jgi:hypothetical protein
MNEANMLRVKTLEALTASQSVWSTVEMQIKLQQGSLVGVGLLVLWCLSPLGGQASLRMLQRSTSTSSTIAPLYYMSTGPASTVFASMVESTSNVPMLSSISPTRDILARHEDVQGNLKIPRLEALNSTATSNGWRDVPLVLEPEHFSSLIGLRVVGLPREKDAHFNLESSYVSAKCETFVQLPYAFNRTRADLQRLSSVMNFNFTRAALKGWMPGDRVGERNIDIRSFILAMDDQSNLQREKAYLGFVPPTPSASDPEAVAPRRLVYGVLYVTNDKRRKEYINVTNCTLREYHVESAVFCPGERVSGGCRVQKMRLSLKDRRPQSVTRFDMPWVAETFSSILPAMVPGTANGSTYVDSFLADSAPQNLLGSPDKQPPIVAYDMSKVSPQKFSGRFTLLLNAFYGQLLSVNLGVSESDLARYSNATAPHRDIDVFVATPPPGQLSTHDQLWRFGEKLSGAIYDAVHAGLPFVPAATTVTASVPTPVYVCNFGWMATLLLAAAALAATGAASLALQLRGSLPPDMLRYVASMTYANPHFRTPPGGTTLDGGERAKLLRDVRVRIGDIRGGDGGSDGGGDYVGEVAFVAADDVPTRKLDCKRLYA